MKQYATPRKSHCRACGKRLSRITSKGAIAWSPSHVDDKGIYCEGCFKAKTAAANGKSAQN